MRSRSLWWLVALAIVLMLTINARGAPMPGPTPLAGYTGGGTSQGGAIGPPTSRQIKVQP